MRKRVWLEAIIYIFVREELVVRVENSDEQDESMITFFVVLKDGCIQGCTVRHVLCRVCTSSWRYPTSIQGPAFISYTAKLTPQHINKASIYYLHVHVHSQTYSWHGNKAGIHYLHVHSQTYPWHVNKAGIYSRLCIHVVFLRLFISALFL